MKTIKILIVAISAGLIAMSGSVYSQTTPTCYPDLPDPELTLEGTEEYTTGGTTFIRYKLDVTNYTQFPDALFEPAPHLPPCGANTNSSRSWVDIYDNNDVRIYGFCGLGSASSLNNIWFAVEKGTAPPSGVYIKIVDRECGITYTSNTISTCYPDLPDPLLTLEGTEEYTTGGTTFIRYRLNVTNYTQFPDVLFAPAPYLPPCGSNTNSSRSWVDIYDNNDVRIYGFCGLGSASDLNIIWFSVEKGTAPPSGVYIKIVDRECDITYTSNTISTPAVTVPSVNTNPVINISTTSASSGGNVTSDGGLTVTTRGVCWNSLPNPTISNNTTDDGSGTGSFTSIITGLTPNTPYYVRAYATNSIGTAYGNEFSFTTICPEISISESIINVSCNGASDGEVTATPSDGTTPYTYAWYSDAALTIPIGQTTQTAINLTAGTYWVEVTDANGCTASTSVTLTEPIALTATATVTSDYNGQDVSCNGANDGTITIIVSGGTVPYEYSIDGGNTYLSNGGNFTGLSAGDYNVSVKDANGCVTSGSLLTVTEPDAISISEVNP